jgi:cytochrome c oxidase subunit 4
MSAHEMTHAGESSHPQSREYVILAVILSVITAVEVFVWYREEIKVILMPVLLTLSAVKFALVVMFYMHLKFDHRLFTGFFLFGLVAAMFMVVAFITLFHFLRAPFPVA